MAETEISPEMEEFCNDLEEFYREYVDQRKELSRQDDEIGVLFEAARGVLHHKGRDVE